MKNAINNDELNVDKPEWDLDISIWEIELIYLDAE
jgi:hypothetical protein